MYEYIKGKKIQLDEHMLSASEIATMYGILTENKQPHSLMISAILREYIRKTNLNVAEYYYPHSKGCMRVYPELLWKPAMTDFTYYHFDVDSANEPKIYKVSAEMKNFVYLHGKSNRSHRIVNINERRNHNGN